MAKAKGGGKAKTKPKPEQQSKALEETKCVSEPPYTMDYYIRCEGGDRYITIRKAKTIRKETPEGVEYDEVIVPEKLIMVKSSFEDYKDEFKSSNDIVYYGKRLPKKYTLTEKELEIVKKELIKRNKRFEIFTINTVENFIPEDE